VAGINSNLLIDTPENLMLEVEIAGFGSRSIAALLDYAIITFLLTMVGCFFGQITNANSDLEGWTLAALIIIIFAIFSFYHLFFEFLWNGQTPGKRRLGLRVVQANGMPATTAGLLIRNFVRWIDFMPIFFGVGLISLFATQQTQRLGDLAARTVVIREQAQVSLKNLKESYAVRYALITRSEEIPAYIDIKKLSEPDRRLIVDYLQRRMSFGRREHLVMPLARKLAVAMDMSFDAPLQTPVAAEKFVEQVARAFELAEIEAEDRA
jgi:uncharacterized RDD family membrane protein YckC